MDTALTRGQCYSWIFLKLLGYQELSPRHGGEEEATEARQVQEGRCEAGQQLEQPVGQESGQR